MLRQHHHSPPFVLCCCCQPNIQTPCRVSCVTFAVGDSLLVAGYEDGSARAFDWRTGVCVSTRQASKAKRRQTSSELTAVLALHW